MWCCANVTGIRELAVNARYHSTSARYICWRLAGRFNTSSLLHFLPTGYYNTAIHPLTCRPLYLSRCVGALGHWGIGPDPASPLYIRLTQRLCIVIRGSFLYPIIKCFPITLIKLFFVDFYKSLGVFALLHSSAIISQMPRI